MNETCFHRLITVALILGFAVPFIAPSGDSIWIDEGYNAFYGRIGSLTGFWEQLRSDPNSQGQMPLGMLVAWISGMLIGTSEWALRAPNILWGLLTLLALLLVGRRVKCTWLPVVAAVHPYFWYYLNEARPYALQIAAGAWMLYALVVFYQECGTGCRWAWALVISGFVACGSIMLGVIAFASVLAVLLITAIRKSWKPSRGAWLVLVLAMLPLTALGVFYLATLLRGAGGARFWQPGLANVAFAAFELVGAAGLTGPRHEIRDLAREQQWLALALQAGLPLMGLLSLHLFLGWKAKRNGTEDHVFIGSSLAVCGITGACLVILSMVAAWPFWGRHLAPIFPFLVFAVAISARLAIQGTRNLAPRVAFGVLMILFLTSSLLVRFSPTHKRDDFRSAAKFARDELAAGRRVWWAAPPIGAWYYDLSLQPLGAAHGALDVYNPTTESLALAATPDVIIMSKPDLCDIHGAVRASIAKGGYRLTRVFPAFTIYRRDVD